MTRNKRKPPGAELPPTDRSLPIALMRAREKVMAPIREMLSQSDVTEQQWRILRVLAEHGPQDATELADRACILLSSLTRISRTMLEKGLIDRRTDEQDRRRYTVSITRAGQAIIDSNRRRAADITARYREQLGAEQYETLLDLLRKIDEV